ncbi:hypothetical protein, partial [Priestia megaterium]|uniref:hypothetical protein n=1 Tax=Priestia megaterium TaxID=1404 RepID=UPI002FFF3BC7
MIKIPSSKYSGLADKHYYNIQDYIMYATQFYLKCCYKLNPGLQKSGIDLSGVDKLHINTQRSLFAAISNLNYKKIEKKYLF